MVILPSLLRTRWTGLITSGDGLVSLLRSRLGLPFRKWLG